MQDFLQNEEEKQHENYRSFTSYRPAYHARKNDYGNSLQARFLRHCIYEQLEVDVYLHNDDVRHGRIAEYDNWSIVLKEADQRYLLFKTGIIAILPGTKAGRGKRGTDGVEQRDERLPLSGHEPYVA